MTIAEDRASVPKKRAPNGETKARILAALMNAGEKGMSVKELSTALSVKPANMYVWFFKNAKQIDGIQKVGRARYRLEQSLVKSEMATAPTSNQLASPTSIDGSI